MDNLIGVRIKKRRKELHLTQVQIKELCGISNGNLSDFENGNRLPSANALIALSKSLRVSVDWILTGENYRNPDILLEKSLSDSETEMLSNFRKLDIFNQEEIKEIIKLKLQQQAKRDGRLFSSSNPDVPKKSSDDGVISA